MIETDLKKEIDQLRSKLKEACQSIKHMANRNGRRLLDTNIVVKAEDGGVSITNSEPNFEIFVDDDKIEELINLLKVFI
jgi:hypothetical protein